MASPYQTRQPRQLIGGNGRIDTFNERVKEAQDKMIRHEDEMRRAAQLEKDKAEQRAFQKERFAWEKMKFQTDQEMRADKFISDHLKAEQALNEAAQMGPYKIAVSSLNPIDPDYATELQALDAKYWAASGTTSGKAFAHGPGSVEDRFKETQARYREMEAKLGFDEVRAFAKYSAKDGSFHSIDTVGLNHAFRKAQLDEARALSPKSAITMNPKGEVTITEKPPADPEIQSAKDRAEALRLQKERRFTISTKITKNNSEMQMLNTAKEDQLKKIAAEKGFTGDGAVKNYRNARWEDLRSQNEKMNAELGTLDSGESPASASQSPAGQTQAPATQGAPTPVPTTPSAPAPAPKKPKSEADLFLENFKPKPTSDAGVASPDRSIADHHASATESVDAHFNTISDNSAPDVAQQSASNLSTTLQTAGMPQNEIQQVHDTIAAGEKPLLVPHPSEPRLTLAPKPSTTDVS